MAATVLGSSKLGRTTGHGTDCWPSQHLTRHLQHPSSLVSFRNHAPWKVVCVSAPVSSNTSFSEGGSSSELPLKEIPGEYGLPFLGSFIDRMDGNVLRPVEKFYERKRDMYGSTVFRTNVPPGPFSAWDNRGVCLVDCKSFEVLYDLSKVDKANQLTGPHVFPESFTGGKRILSMLDPSEPKFAALKSLVTHMMKSGAGRVIPQIQRASSLEFSKWNAAVAQGKKIDLKESIGELLWEFLFTTWIGRSPSAPGEFSMGSDGQFSGKIWLLLLLGPVLPDLPLPRLVQELTVHNFRFPFFLVSGLYEKIFQFIIHEGKELLDDAENLWRLEREEAAHNLLFATVVNAWAGLRTLWPKMMEYVSLAGPGLQRDLAQEVRQAVENTNGVLSVKSVTSMPLVQSVVWESLRLCPPVPMMYGRAKMDIEIESWDARFKIKKGELLAGYLVVAHRDKTVFRNPNEFDAHRFMGEEGQKVLPYLRWSGGPETGSPTTSNKQCGGKDSTNLFSCLFLANLFLTYDGFRVDGEDASLFLPGKCDLLSLKPRTKAPVLV